MVVFCNSPMRKPDCFRGLSKDEGGEDERTHHVDHKKDDDENDDGEVGTRGPGIVGRRIGLDIVDSAEASRHKGPKIPVRLI